MLQKQGYEPGALLNYITSVNKGFSAPTDGKSLDEMVPLVIIGPISLIINLNNHTFNHKHCHVFY